MPELIFRRLVRPEDLNPANRLFGGRLMAWGDEAAAVYAMFQMKTRDIVTLKVSEIIFKHPAYQGDILDFFAKPKKIGNTSFTIELVVQRKQVDDPDTHKEEDEILKCEFVFVHIDEDGKPKPHGLEKL